MLNPLQLLFEELPLPTFPAEGVKCSAEAEAGLRRGRCCSISKETVREAVEVD